MEEATEVLFIVQQIHVEELLEVASETGDSVVSFPRGGNTNQNFLTVNGQVNPIISIKPGEWIRLRTIYAAWLEGNLDLTIPGNCEINLLAKDGIYIRDFPRRIQTAPIVPGGRADLMVRCLDSSSTYNILGGDNHGIIATIETTADEPATVNNINDLQAWTTTYPAYLSNLRNSTASPGCSYQTILDNNIVNDIAYNPNKVLHTTYLASIVDRRINAVGHPYHQHVYPYQLISDGFGNGGYHAVGDWHDTVIGEGIIRYQPTEFKGKVMIHCHRSITPRRSGYDGH